jgi:hypothetical protein
MLDMLLNNRTKVPYPPNVWKIRKRVGTFRGGGLLVTKASNNNHDLVNKFGYAQCYAHMSLN